MWGAWRGPLILGPQDNPDVLEALQAHVSHALVTRIKQRPEVTIAKTI